VNEQLTSARPKPALNEEAFQQLLEAAYVIQQQNDRAHGKSAKPDSNRILSEIIETQRLIRSGPLDVNQATQLILERLHAVTSASWAAVGYVVGDEIQYQGINSSGVSFAPEAMGIDACPAAPCLRTGEALRYPDFAGNSSKNFAAYTAMGVASLIAVPVYAEGVVAGILEVGFPRVNGFEEKEVSACQLMAGLVTEAMARAAEFEWKQALASERATMLETLERIKPQLERLAEPAPAVGTPLEVESKPEPTKIEPAKIEQPQIEETLCRGCANRIADEEAFCGICGLPSPNQKPSGDIQSKWASLWHMQQAADQKKKSEHAVDPESSGGSDAALLALKKLSDQALSEDLGTEDEVAEEKHVIRILPEDDSAVPQGSPWTSAMLARKWLDSLKPPEEKKIWLAKQWRRHRANVYLGASVLLLITVIAGWDTAGGAPRMNPSPRLSLVDKALISLNLAEAPPAPVYLGNPETKVWVDTHTALYYCPGEDLYGKTAEGKMTTQRDAQLDSFQPALRKVCD